MPASNVPKRRKHKPPKNGEWKWETAEEEAFTTMKRLLTSYPILAYPDFQRPFELHTDASFLGLGAILYQDFDGTKRAISYASRSLSKSERNYPAHKLEFLALKWSVCEKFHDYLYGNQFTAITDNNPLTYVLTSAKLDATSQRWVAALATYNFDIKYRPGVANADADGLSRLPGLQTDREEETSATITPEAIKALCKGTGVTAFVDTITTSVDVIDELTSCCQINAFDTEKAQLDDQELRWWKPYVAAARKLDKDVVPQTAVHQLMYRNFDRLHLVNNVMYRRRAVDGNDQNQLVVPRSLVPVVLRFVHDDMGHQGRDKTTSLLRDRFFWCGMSRDVEDYIKNCTRCIRRKTPTTQRAPLVSIKTTHPLELVCMDYLSLETSKGGYSNILVITDHFTRYAVAVPTRNQTARTTAEAFLNNFVVHYGLPERIHSDQGANFQSKLLREICTVTGMDKSRTTPYNPRGNGVCERYNKSLLDMLGTLEPEQKHDWKAHVTSLVHAYNCTRQETTGQSPYLLMFGREPNLPVDLFFDLNNRNNDIPLTQYAEGLKNRLRSAYELAANHADKAQRRQKKNYDKKVRNAAVRPGDLVLVRIVAFDGKHKLSDKWEEEPYIVLKQPNADIPVFEVRKRNGEGRRRTLHRNLLLPFTSRDEEIQSRSTSSAAHRPTPVPRKTRRQKPVNRDTESTVSDNNGYADSEEESVVEVVITDVNVQPDVTGSQNDFEEEGDPETESAQEGEDAGDVLSSERKDEASGEEDENQEPAPPDVDDVDRAAERRHPSPIPAPRRSVRERRPPDWFHSSEHSMAAQPQPDWIQRVEYIRTLVDSGTLRDCGQQAADTILKIVSNHL